MSEEMLQCPTCGRIREHWDNPETKKLGVAACKDRQRKDKEDRTIAYKDWRRTLGRGYYASDIDFIEWRYVDGKPVPVAVIELTRVDGESIPVPDSYLQQIQNRWDGRDAQGSYSKIVAKALGVNLYIVLWRWDLSEFWVYNTEVKRWFKNITLERYQQFIKRLGGVAHR